MEVFVAVVDAGSLTAAATRLGLSGQMAGKHMRALEARLGATLLTRSTRRQSLTEVGRSYYERCKRVLDEVHQAEACADLLRAAPRGRLRISTTVNFGTQCLAPALTEYLLAYPELSAELVLDDHVVDIVEQGFDVAIRVGPLPDSGLMARKLAPYEMMICAAPEYLSRQGTPQVAADLAQHQCLGFTHWRRRGGGWNLRLAEAVATPGRFDCNHGPALRMAALRGFGLVMQPAILLAEDVKAGRLVSVLPEALPPPLPVHLVYPRTRTPLPKLRTFIDFAVARFGECLSGPETAPPAARVKATRARPVSRSRVS